MNAPIPGTVTITQPMTVDFGSTKVEFNFDDDITAQVERLPYETLLNLWNARGSAHELAEIGNEAFLAALTMRLMRGKSIGNTGTKLVLFDHYANR